jgi:hypothetical protein
LIGLGSRILRLLLPLKLCELFLCQQFYFKSFR